MREDIQLPENYKVLPRLVLCGNTLVDVKIPFEVEGGVPLLIGDGGEPQIWLNARPPRPDMKWYPVVRQNRPLHEASEVLGLGSEVITVRVQGIKVLTVEKRQPDTVEVTQLDLRPLGLNIHGDRARLLVGSNQLVSNTFENVYVMVGIGEKKGAGSS